MERLEQPLETGRGYALVLALLEALARGGRIKPLAGGDASPEPAPDWDARAARFISFLMDNLPAEMAIFGVRTAFGHYRLDIRSDQSPFGRFSDRFKGMIVWRIAACLARAETCYGTSPPDTHSGPEARA
jgi:hypothetical protein